MPRAFAASSTVCRGVVSGPTLTAPKKVLVPVASAVAPAALPVTTWPLPRVSTSPATSKSPTASSCLANFASVQCSTPAPSAMSKMTRRGAV